MTTQYYPDGTPIPGTEDPQAGLYKTQTLLAQPPGTGADQFATPATTQAFGPNPTTEYALQVINDSLKDNPAALDSSQSVADVVIQNAQEAGAKIPTSVARQYPSTTLYTLTATPELANAYGQGLQYVQQFFGDDAAVYVHLHMLPPEQRAIAEQALRNNAAFQPSFMNAMQTTSPSVLNTFEKMLPALAAHDYPSILGTDRTAELDKVAASINGLGNIPGGSQDTPILSPIVGKFETDVLGGASVSLSTDYVKQHPIQAIAIYQYLTEKTGGKAQIGIEDGGVVSDISNIAHRGMNLASFPATTALAGLSTAEYYGVRPFRAVGEAIARQAIGPDYHPPTEDSAPINQSVVPGGLGFDRAPQEWKSPGQVFKDQLSAPMGGGLVGGVIQGLGFDPNDPNVAGIETAVGVLAAQVGADPLQDFGRYTRGVKIGKETLASQEVIDAGSNMGLSTLVRGKITDPTTLDQMATAAGKSYLAKKAFLSTIRTPEDVVIHPAFQNFNQTLLRGAQGSENPEGFITNLISASTKGAPDTDLVTALGQTVRAGGGINDINQTWISHMYGSTSSDAYHSADAALTLAKNNYDELRTELARSMETSDPLSARGQELVSQMDDQLAVQARARAVLSGGQKVYPVAAPKLPSAMRVASLMPEGPQTWAEKVYADLVLGNHETGAYRGASFVDRSMSLLSRLGSDFPKGEIVNPEVAFEDGRAAALVKSYSTQNLKNLLDYYRIPVADQERVLQSYVTGSYGEFKDFIKNDLGQTIRDNSPIYSPVHNDIWEKVWDPSAGHFEKGIITEALDSGIRYPRPTAYRTELDATGRLRQIPIEISPDGWAQSYQIPTVDKIRSTVSLYRKFQRDLAGTNKAGLIGAKGLQALHYAHTKINALWKIGIIAGGKMPFGIIGKYVANEQASMAAAGFSSSFNHPTEWWDMMGFGKHLDDPNFDIESLVNPMSTPDHALGQIVTDLRDNIEKYTNQYDVYKPGAQGYGRAIASKFDQRRSWTMNRMLAEGQDPQEVLNWLSDPANRYVTTNIYPYWKTQVAKAENLPDELAAMTEQKKEIDQFMESINGGTSEDMRQALLTRRYTNTAQVDKAFQDIYDQLKEDPYGDLAKRLGVSKRSTGVSGTFRPPDEVLRAAARKEAAANSELRLGSSDFSDAVDRQVEMLNMGITDPAQLPLGDWHPTEHVSGRVPDFLASSPGRWGRFLDKNFERFIAHPDVVINRVPLYRQLANSKITELKALGWDDARAAAGASEWATDQTRAFLGDLSQLTTAQEFGKQFFPFFRAWTTVAKRWALNIPRAYGNWGMGVVMEARMAQNMGQLFHALGILKTDPTTGETYGNVPGVGALSKALGLPFDEVTFRPEELTLLSSLPGLGPLETIALGSAARKFKGPFEALANLLMPFSNDFQVGPSAMNSLWTGAHWMFGMNQKGPLGPTPPWELASYGTIQTRNNMALENGMNMARADIGAPPNPDEYGQGVSDPKYRTDFASWQQAILHKGMTYAGTAYLLHGLSAMTAPLTLTFSSSDQRKARDLWQELSVYPDGSPVKTAALDAFNQTYPDANWWLTGKTINNGGKPLPDPATYKGFLDQIWSGDRLIRTPDEYLQWASGLESFRMFHAQVGDVIQQSGGTGPGVLRNYYAYKTAHGQYQNEFSTFLAWSHTLVDGTDTKSFKQMWEDAQQNVPDNAGASFFDEIRATQARSAMSNLTGLLTDNGAVKNKEWSAAIAQVDQLLGDKVYGAPSSPVMKQMAWYWDSVARPYYTKQEALYNQIKTLPQAEAGPYYTQIRQLANSATEQTHGGLTYPTPEEVSFAGQSPDQQKQSVAHWASLPPEWLTNFQLQKSYGKSVTPQVEGFLNWYDTQEQNFTAQVAAAGQSPTSAYGQSLRASLDTQEQSYAASAGASQFYGAIKAPIYQRLSAANISTNTNWTMLVTQMRGVDAQFAAAGISPAGSTAQAQQAQSYIYSEIEQMRSTDPSFDALMHRLELAEAGAGQDSLNAQDMYAKVFFGAQPPSLAVIGG